MVVRLIIVVVKVFLAMMHEKRRRGEEEEIYKQFGFTAGRSNPPSSSFDLP